MQDVTIKLNREMLREALAACYFRLGTIPDDLPDELELEIFGREERTPFVSKLERENDAKASIADQKHDEMRDEA